MTSSALDVHNVLPSQRVDTIINNYSAKELNVVKDIVVAYNVMTSTFVMIALFIPHHHAPTGISDTLYQTALSNADYTTGKAYKLSASIKSQEEITCNKDVADNQVAAIHYISTTDRESQT